jgi:hypothetical protein
VNLFPGYTDFGDGRDVLAWNIPFALAAVLLNFTPILRGVVFIGESARVTRSRSIKANERRRLDCRTLNRCF